jgi:hypothetical protein
MSLPLQKLVWKLHLHPSQKLVLVRLADYASDKDHRAYPSVSSLAEDTGLSERMVQRYLAASVDAGLIVIEENGSGGRGKTRTYRFTLQKGDTHDANPAHDLPEKGDTDDTVSRTERVTPMTRKGDTHDALLPKERVTSRTERVTSSAQKGDTHDATYIRSEPSVNHQGEPSVALPRNGAAQTLVAVLYEDVLRIGKPTNYSQVVGQAAQLVKAGCTPDELRDIAGWLAADPFWSQKGITMGTILGQRDKWRAARNAPPPRAPAGYQGAVPLTPGPRGYSPDQLRKKSELERLRESS